jgi:hypothetical protein
MKFKFKPSELGLRILPHRTAPCRITAAPYLIVSYIPAYVVYTGRECDY